MLDFAWVGSYSYGTHRSICCEHEQQTILSSRRKTRCIVIRTWTGRDSATS